MFQWEWELMLILHLRLIWIEILRVLMAVMVAVVVVVILNDCKGGAIDAIVKHDIERHVPVHVPMILFSSLSVCVYMCDIMNVCICVI
jgi:hypothetical protein